MRQIETMSCQMEFDNNLNQNEIRMSWVKHKRQQPYSVKLFDYPIAWRSKRLYNMTYVYEIGADLIWYELATRRSVHFSCHIIIIYQESTTLCGCLSIWVLPFLQSIHSVLVHIFIEFSQNFEVSKSVFLNFNQFNLYVT